MDPVTSLSSSPCPLGMFKDEHCQKIKTIHIEATATEMDAPFMHNHACQLSGITATVPLSVKIDCVHPPRVAGFRTVHINL